MASSNDELLAGEKLRSVSDFNGGERYGSGESFSEDGSNESSSHQETERAIIHHSPSPLLRSRRESSSDESSTHQAKGRPIVHHITQRNTSERSPLIRPREEGDITDDGLNRVQIFTNQRRYGTGHIVPRRRTPQPESRHWLLEYITSTLSMRSSSVMVFMVLVVLGIVLTAAANLNLNKAGLQVEPSHVLIYIMCLMFVFIVWVMVSIFPKTLQCSSARRGALIPSHLLTGIGIFGSVSAMSEMLSFIDFIKCSRHVNNLSVIYGIYPFLKSFFMYCQIYFFYKLSRDGIRNCKVPGGNFFIMVTLATNMCIWWAAFLNDASNNPKLESITWLNHYHFGVYGYDACANASITSPQAKQLHDTVSYLQPYIVTFSMEYALLASGLLLHVWQSIKESDSSQSQISGQQYWTLWRVGFIIGLLSIPFIVVSYIHKKQAKDVGFAKVILLFFQGTICSVLLFFSLYCMRLLRKLFVKIIDKPMKVEVILLGISFVGFPIIDLCGCFAAVAEVGNLTTSEVVWFGLSSVAELAAAGLQFLFIKEAYEYKLPDVAEKNVHTAMQRIRQFASFALVVNIAYWGAKTHELRTSSGSPGVSEKFFGSYTWFGLSHLAYPLCIFFHFHLATCFANVVCFYSQFGPFVGSRRPAH